MLFALGCISGVTWCHGGGGSGDDAVSI